VHLLAELIENAVSFSPPASPIVVTAAGDGDGDLIEVTDRGLGMTDDELAWASRRLTGNGVVEPAGRPAGDRLGLLIVAHLAARNGFRAGSTAPPPAASPPPSAGPASCSGAAPRPRPGPADRPAAGRLAGAFLRTTFAGRLSNLPYPRYVAAHAGAATIPLWPG
jgi:hypothetical protein